MDLKQFAEHLSFYAPRKWPPPAVIPGLSVLIVGFPMKYRRIYPMQRAIKFDSFNLKTQVSSVSEHGFICAVETTSTRNPSPDAVWPETYGGTSGCPVFSIRGTPSVLDLVGIVYEASDNWDAIYAHHACLVSSDGTLKSL